MTTPRRLNRDTSTAAGFLSERHDFLYVHVVKSAGDGWDVVVRIDGSYAERASAEGAAEGIRMMMDRLTDVDKTNRFWWDGPPWKTGAIHANKP